VEAIRILRAIADIKSQELARRVSVTPGYLSKVESGAEKPSSELTVRLVNEIEKVLADGGGER
jgi:transcriptional regulator with XRE-family HTH domain